MNFVLWRDRLTLLVVTLLPWQARYLKEPGSLFGAPWEQGTVAIFATEILLGLALLFHLFVIVQEPSPRVPAPLWLRLSALLPAFAFVSLWWAPDARAGIFTLLHLCEGYVLAFLLWKCRVPLASLLRAFVYGTTLSAAFGLRQFFTQTSFASTWLGMAAHPVSQAGVSVIETASGRFLRAYGTLPHPNVLGGYAAAGLLSGFALASDARRPRTLVYVALVLLGAGLAASFSRGAWLAAFAALTIALVLPRTMASIEAKRTLLPSACAALAGALCVVLFALPAFSSRLSFQGRLESRSVSERLTAAVDASALFSRHVATGVGIGNVLPAAIVLFGPPKDPYAMQPPHLAPLLVAVELGVVGLALLAGFVLLWLLSALRLMRRAASPLAAIAATLPLIIVIVSCFDHYPFDLFAGTMLTGACFGFFLKAGEHEAD